MASPPQSQQYPSTESWLANMEDVNHLVLKVQDVQDIRRKMQQLEGDLQQERQSCEGLQESIQQNKLGPTNSEIQKLQDHIQQLEYNVKEMDTKRVQLLKECVDCLDQCQNRLISRLKQWRWEQQKAAIGHPFDNNLNPLQTWCEQLFEVNQKLRQEVMLTGEPIPELQERLGQLLEVLVKSSLVVDKQPPQVIYLHPRFSTTVRCLLGEKVEPVELRMNIINELQARNLGRIPDGDDAGELFHNVAVLKYDKASKSTCATFRNIFIRNIKRGSEPVTEQKFALLFSTEIIIPGCDSTCRIQMMSLPMVIMSSLSQYNEAQYNKARATIMWDYAFSEADREPFVVPEQVTWKMLFSTLNTKFTAEVQTQHGLDHHNQQFLAQKIFDKPDCADDFSNMTVFWAQFIKEDLPGRWFTFWQWFEGVMELTKEHLKTYWNEGLIFGFIGKQHLHQILKDRPNGTFLLHFSDSEIGGITISYVTVTEKGEPKIQNIQPFTMRDLEIRSLGDHIRDISHITHLYPDFPKHDVFKRFYSETQASAMGGYIPVSLHTKVGMEASTDTLPTHSVTTWSEVDIPGAMEKSLFELSERQTSGMYGGYFQSSPVENISCPQSVSTDRPPSSQPSSSSKRQKRNDSTSGDSEDNSREMELHAIAGPSTFQLSTIDGDNFAALYDRKKEWDEYSSTGTDSELGFYLSPDMFSSLRNRKDTDDCGPIFNPGYIDYTERRGAQDAYELSSAHSENASEGDSDAMMEMEASGTAVDYSFTSHVPTHPLFLISPSSPGCSTTDSSCLSRSHSVPSLSQTTSPENKTFTRAQSLPDMLLKSSFEEFTPDITVDEDDETYRFQCSCPGLYQCSVTGLVFHMEGEEDVVYRTVPWNRRLLAQHHKQPAGPLFDIKCLQQSVCQLHLPHCEISSTAGGEFLSVAHVDDEGIEFIAPHKVTETHVIVNITGFSGFGNVKDEDSPPDLVQALVLLFYSPPADPDIKSFLGVLLLPRNIVIRDVRRTRKKLFGEEMLIRNSSYCKLHPKQEYTLSTCPEDDSVLVQPKQAEFDEESYANYLSSFDVTFKTLITNIKLLLKGINSSHIVWEREVCFPSTGVRRSCRQGSSTEQLFCIRSNFINGISEPVLKSLLDKLFEKTVMTDSERESTDKIQNREDKARFVIDTVRKKGEDASSEMIEFLCEVDPFLCKHLGLI